MQLFSDNFSNFSEPCATSQWGALLAGVPNELLCNLLTVAEVAHSTCGILRAGSPLNVPVA